MFPRFFGRVCLSSIAEARWFLKYRMISFKLETMDMDVYSKHMSYYQEHGDLESINRIQGEVIKRLQAEIIYLRERLYSNYRHERLVWQHEQYFLRKFFNDFERTLLGLVKNVPSDTSINFDVQHCLNLLNRFKQETV